ncbi:MAG: hypothetical protein IPJ23_17355 [Ignavibacteriales bacterium]|nr:hypothetical protein [Ignavibacteriales bacterium]
MDLEQLEIQETEQLENLFESNAIKFNKFKHTYFKNYLGKNESYLDFLKMGSRHFSFQFQENIDEIFLKKENSPMFWLLESPLLTTCEKLFIENLTGNQQSDRTEIKKNFTKWVIASEPSQRKMFAALTLKEIKNSSTSLTFIDLIYHSLILIFEETIRNPYKAIEELIKAQLYVDESALSAEIKKELIYLIQLYKSFAFLSIGNNEEAATELSFAINIKDSGIVARFYFAYLSAVQKREDFTKALIKEILKFDLDRLNYAIDCSSIVSFNFFLNNPVFPNICYYYEFAPFTDYIQQDLIENDLDRKRIVQSLVQRLNQLRKYEFDEYYSDETRHTIKFLYELNEQHAHNLSIFLSLAANYINEKFHSVLDDIQSKIKEKLYENYNRVMELYQKSIEDSENLSNQFKHEVDDIKSSLQKKLATQITQIEEYVKDELWEVEERRKNLPYQSSFDPAVSFRNSMSYNVVVSIIVFIIGGIAGYFNNSNYFESDFYLMLGRVVLTGVKWSSLTFVIGFFISALISGLVLFDRSNEKQKLEKRTLELQKQKEMSLDMLKKEAEQKQKALSEGYIERIESHKRKIEETKREKERQEPILIAEAEKLLSPFTEKLNPLYLN